MGVLSVLTCVMLIIVFPCSGHRDKNHIKAKIGSYVQGAPWKLVGWKADMKGSMLLSVVQNYRVPLKGTLAGNGYFHNAEPRSCSDIKGNDTASDGVYTIFPLPSSRPNGTRAYCDMTTDGGGWTVFQRRFNGETSFDRNWKNYKEGFGKADGEYWLGNDVLHAMTMKGNCRLRIDMVTRDGYFGYAVYQNFTVGSEKEAYVLRIGQYSGTAGENVGYGLSYQNGMDFSTKDRDNDLYKSNCASVHKSGFWFKSCFRVNLNALFKSNDFFWNQWRKTKAAAYLKRSKMMLKC